jgi:hypothetical protein
MSVDWKAKAHKNRQAHLLAKLTAPEVCTTCGHGMAYHVEGYQVNNGHTKVNFCTGVDSHKCPCTEFKSSYAD